MVVLFAFFYTDVLFQQQNYGENLKRVGAQVPGVTKGADNIAWRWAKADRTASVQTRSRGLCSTAPWGQSGRPAGRWGRGSHPPPEGKTNRVTHHAAQHADGVPTPSDEITISK